MNVIVSDVSEGGVSGGELEGAAVLLEVSVGLFCCGVLADQDTVVC